MKVYLVDRSYFTFRGVKSGELSHARVGENCTVGPNAYLRPQTKVGDNCRIGSSKETVKPDYEKNIRNNR